MLYHLGLDRVTQMKINEQILLVTNFWTVSSHFEIKNYNLK